jgi:hypothetical protein
MQCWVISIQVTFRTLFKILTVSFRCLKILPKFYQPNFLRFLICPMRAACSVHLILLYWITITTSVEQKYYEVEPKVTVFTQKRIHQSKSRTIPGHDLMVTECWSSQNMKVTRLSALRTGRLFPPGSIPCSYDTPVRDWVDTSAMLRPEGLCQWK